MNFDEPNESNLPNLVHGFLFIVLTSTMLTSNVIFFYSLNSDEMTQSGIKMMVKKLITSSITGGDTTSWTIVEPQSSKTDSSLLTGATLYKLMKRHLLTLEQ